MFATINIQKIKTMAELVGRFKHNRRIKISKNIKEEYIHTDILDTDNAPELIKNRIKEISDIRSKAGAKKLRSDTVPAVELVLGASHDFFKEKSREYVMEWAQTQMEWAKEYYKDRGKLITYDLHMESEKTPHLHLIFIPENNENDLPTLSAKKFMGNKSEMRRVRTAHSKVNEKYDLKRGKDYYKDGEIPPPNMSLTQLRRKTRQASDDGDDLDLEILESINELKQLKTAIGVAKKTLQNNKKMT